MKLEIIPNFFIVYHQHYYTDRYATGSTIVQASNKKEAMEKLNKHLALKLNGGYTPLPCESIKDVHELKALK